MDIESTQFNHELDTAIGEAEMEFQRHGILFDAQEALKGLREKQQAAENLLAELAKGMMSLQIEGGLSLDEAFANLDADDTPPS